MTRSPSVARRTRVPSPVALLEALEQRVFLSAAFDIVGITSLRADPAYTGVDGSGIGIAIIDTGIHATHPDLAANYVAWYDAVTRSSNAAPFDNNGHGSHVAGTAASTNPDIGVANAARLIAIRGLADDNESRPRHDTVAESLQWVIENYHQYNIRVVNMSLGVAGVNINTTQPRTSEQATRIAELERLGITVVTASGNGYADFADPGASVPAIWSTIQVANTWEDAGVGDRFPTAGGGPDWAAVEYGPLPDQFAASSQRSTLLNQVTAPGSTIYSTWNGSGGQLYNTISGTSMASPLVAGAVALIQDAAITFGGSYLLPHQVLTILRDTADTLIDANTDRNGRARIIYTNDGRATLGPVENLPETGETYFRVNVHRAIQRTVQIVTGGGEGQDFNSRIATAVTVPGLDGTRAYTFDAIIANDGSSNIGADDVDLYQLEVVSPGMLSLATSPAGNAGLTAAVRLFSSTGTPLAIALGTDGTPYPTLTTERIEPGFYYVGVSSIGNTAYLITDGSNAAGGSSQGQYTLNISLSNPDPNGVIQGAVPFDGLPNFFNGLIGADLGLDVGSEDVDFFEIIAPDTGKLIIDIDAVSVHGSEAVDSYVRVFNDALVQIAFNDDESAQNTDSYLEVAVIKGQRLFVAVADYQNRDFNPIDPFDRSDAGPGGFYDIYFLFDNRDANGTIFTATDATIGLLNVATIGIDNLLTVGADGTKDVDFYRYTAGAAGLFDIHFISEDGLLPGSLSLWRYQANALEADRIGEASGTNARLIVELAEDESIYAAVTGRQNAGFHWFSPGSGAGGEKGTYSLVTSLRPLTDVAGIWDNAVNNGTPVDVALGDSLSAILGSDGALILAADDLDLFRFTATQSGTVRIRTYAPDEGSADTFLRVFDSAGSEIAFNDDIGPANLSSLVTINAIAGHTYYIGVSGYSPQGNRDYNPLTGVGVAAGSTGRYTLIVQDGTLARLTPGNVLNVNANNAGATAATSISTFGTPVVFRQSADGAAWSVTDLVTATNGPDVAGEVVTWTDPKDGLLYAAARTNTGVVLYTNTSANNWTYRILTDEVAGALAVAGELTVFVSTNGLVHLAALRSNGDLVLYQQTGAGNAAAYEWQFIDLANDHLRAQSLQMPSFTGRIISYVTSWNGLNIAGLDPQGNIHSVWWAPGLNLWTTNNLSLITGAPALSGGLTAYLTSWDGINLAGTDTNGKVSVTWWVPQFVGDWANSNLSDLFAGPTLDPSSVTSYVTSWGGLNIAGRDQSTQKVVIYWWTPTLVDWQVTILTDFIDNPTPLTGPITGLASPTGTLNLFATAANGDLIRYWWRPELTWSQQNLTSLATPVE